MCNSFNNSISHFFKSQRFEFKGKSLRIQMGLFANWLYKILKIKSVTVYGANILFVCLVARPLGILGEEVDEKNLTQWLQLQQQEFYWWFQFLFFQLVCNFFNWVNFSEIPVSKLSWGLIIGTVSKAKSFFVEPLNEVQVRDGQMGRKDQKASNLLVKLTL